MKRLLIFCAGFLCSASVHAHEIYTSYSSIEIIGVRLTYILTLDEAELKYIFELDKNKDGSVTENELNASVDEIYAFFEKKFSIIVGGETIELKRGEGHVSKDDLGNVFINLVFEQTLDHQPWKLTLSLNIFDNFGPRHKNLVKVIHQDQIQQGILTIGSPWQDFSFSG